MSLKNKKFILSLIIYFFSFVFTYFLFVFIEKIYFIPILNNSIIIFNFISFISCQIFFVINLFKLKNKEFLKILFFILIVILAFLWLYIMAILSIFAVKDNNPFLFENQKYYYVNEGWLDPYYEIYKKKFFTMDKLNEKEIEKIFSDLKDIKDEGARDILKIIKEKGKPDIKNKTPKEKVDTGKEKEAEPEMADDDVEEDPLKENFEEDYKNKQKIVDKFSFKDSKKIENSDFALLEVDHAGPRTHWFFVKIKDEKLIFISELEDTSPSFEGKVDHKGNIYLTFKDINGNINRYKSQDGGRTWETYK